MITLLTIGLVIVLGVVFSFRLAWGCYALIFTLPFERIGAWALNPATGHPVVRLSQVVGAALVAAYGVNVVLRRVRLRRLSGALWLLAGFGVWCGVSLGHTFHPQLVSGYVALLFVLALVYTLYALMPQLELRKLQAALMLSGGLVALFGLYQFVGDSLGLSPTYTGLRAAYTKQVFGFARVQSTALEPLYFANYLLLPLFVGVGVRLFSPQQLPKWQRVALIGMGLAFVLTLSRGAFIGALGGGLGVGVLSWLNRSQLAFSIKKAGYSLGVAALVVALGLALVAGASALSMGSLLKGPQQFIELVTTQLTHTGSFTDRTSMREQALAIWRAEPVFGVGIEGITPYLRHYPPTRSQGDVIALNNQLLELLAETGVVGAGLFYGFWVSLVWAGGRPVDGRSALGRAWAIGLSGALIAITIQAQSFSGFLLTHIWVVYGLLAGLGGTIVVGASRKRPLPGILKP